MRALSTKHYAPFLLLILIERDTFMKTTDFTVFDEAIESSSQTELNEIANQSNEHEDRFLRFLRYVNLLDESDPKKVHGKKFIELIFSMDKFRAY